MGTPFCRVSPGFVREAKEKDIDTRIEQKRSESKRRRWKEEKKPKE
jgi:hypothetical protein